MQICGTKKQLIRHAYILFIYERLESLLLTTGMLSLQEMFNWAGSKTWDEAGDRITSAILANKET